MGGDDNKASPDDAREDETVSRSDFMKSIRSEMHDETGLLALPLCLILLLFFSGSVMGHERSVERQSIRSAIRDDIIENANFDYLQDVGWGNEDSGVFVGFKNMENVHQPYDVIAFLQQGYFPNMIWTVSENATDEMMRARSYLQYNRIIGGVRVLTQTMEESEEFCRNTNLATIMQTPCMGKPTDDPQTEGFDDLAFMPDGEETTAWSAGPTYDPKATISKEWFLLTESRAVHESRLADMLSRDPPFINRKVRHVVATMMVWNADLRLICIVECNFFFARTGRVWPVLRIKTMDPDPFRKRSDDMPVWVWDGLWLIFLLWNFVKDFWLLIYFLRKVGAKGLQNHLPHGLIWYALDVFGLTVGLTLVFTYWNYWDKVKDIQGDLLNIYGEGIYGDAVVLDSFLEQVEQAVHTVSGNYTTVLLFYPISLIVRLGLAFSGQPRLSVVSRTISTAFTDLYHYLIVFVAFLMTFTCLAMTIFGRELEQFSTLSRAMQSCTRMLFGDTDWDDMQAAGFIKAVGFFWVFHALMVMVMFNILLAIIMDAYELVREDVMLRALGGPPLTLPQQTHQMLDRMYKNFRRERVSLHHVWLKFFQAYGESVFEEEALSRKQIKVVVPGMPPAQADRLFDRTRRFTAKQEQNEAESVDVKDAVDKLEAESKKILEQLVGKGLADDIVNQISKDGEDGHEASVALQALANKDSANKDGARVAPPQMEDTAPTAQVILPPDIGAFHNSDSDTMFLDDMEKVLKYAVWLARDAPPAVFHSTQLALTLAQQDSTKAPGASSAGAGVGLAA